MTLKVVLNIVVPVRMSRSSRHRMSLNRGSLLIWMDCMLACVLIMVSSLFSSCLLRQSPSLINISIFLDNCALTQNDGKCTGNDLRFSFIGYTGIVTEVNNDATIPTVRVTFNNNRTSYEFVQTDVKLELYKSQYELWWVVRSPAFNTVQKKKGFNITNPQCTFDNTNNRYFPYAILKDGAVLDSSVYP